MAGRKKITKYDDIIPKLYKDGFTVKQISAKLGISEHAIWCRIPKDVARKRGPQKQGGKVDAGKCMALARAGWSMANIIKEAEFDLKREVSEGEICGALRLYHS